MTYKSLIAWCLLLSSFIGKSQDEGDLFLQAGVDDAGLIIQKYFEPVFEGVGYGYTNSWYNTAESHEPLGFDISISANIAFIPKAELNYTFNNSEFSNIQLTNGSSAEVPTVLGPHLKSERPELTFFNDGEEVIRATSPPGVIDLKQEVGANIIPVPMIQAGVGLVKETDLILRFVPPISFGENAVKVSMLGYGLKHNLSQWIEILEFAGVDISLLAGYSNLKLSMDLTEEDDSMTTGNEGVFKMNGFVLQGIISKEYINVFTIYGGLGFSRAGSRTRILGTYPIDQDFDQLPQDPIDLKYNDGSMNLTMGLRARLVAITISAAYTLQDYPVLSFGFGVTVR